MYRHYHKWRSSPKTIARLQKLAQRLGLPHPVTYTRLYPGVNQRSAGAWSWCAQGSSGLDIFASTEPLIKILAAPEVDVYYHPYGFDIPEVDSVHPMLFVGPLQPSTQRKS